MTTPNERKSAFSVLRTSAATCALVLALGVPLAAQAYVFNAVQISGNASIADSTILSYAGIARGEQVSAGQLNDAAQAIRATGLFESVEVVVQGNTLVIDVVERPTINRIAIEGNSKLKDERLLSLVQSQSRRAFDPAIVERDTAAITQAYASEGRVNAVVQPQIIRRDQNRVDLIFDVSEGGVTEISRIGFVGNRNFSDRRLRGVLGTKEAGLLRAFVSRDTYSPERLDFDRRVLSEFYHARGYMDFVITNVDVSLSEERDRYLVTFNIQEGQRFTVGSVNVQSDMAGVDPALFEGAVRLRAGQVYSPVNVDADIERMERIAQRNGVNFLSVQPRIDRDERGVVLNVTYVLTEGQQIFVERIDVEGNTTTLDRVVRNQFSTAEGDPFNPRQIRESAERIRALGFFANANVNARQGSRPDQVVIDVDLQEQPTGSLSFGGNYNSDDGISLVANFKEQNFLGRGQYLSAGINVGRNSRNFNFGFSEPNLLGRNLSFGLNMAYATTNNQNAKYDTATGSFKPSVSFPISYNGRLNVYYSYDYTRLYGLPDVGSADDVSGIVRREAGLGGVGTNAVGYNYSWDTARSGSSDDKWRMRFQVGQQFGLSSAEQQFIKTTASATAQTRVWNEDITLRATVEGGHLAYQKGYSRVTDRFFMGSNIMRGFDVGGIGPRDATTGDALGGNMYAAARLEAEFPMGLPEEYGIHGGAFVDIGSLWDVGNTNGANVLYNDFSARAVVGVSVFWDTPVGPLRFNFTRPLQNEDQDKARNFDVTISTSF